MDEGKYCYTDKAIIMAAGVGRRMQPLTLETPKPLVSVNGVRMIDSVIQALHENGIDEIYVVVGYLKEQFLSLTEEYDHIHLIENPWYDRCNNIASLYVAREHLQNCMILDGDQLIRNKTALSPYFRRSGYNAVWREDDTKEWLMTMENGVVTSCSRNGGSHGWQLYSVSRWNAEDGDKLRRQLEWEFERGNTDIYWDDVPMFCYFDQYRLGIWQMQDGDIVEIDDLEELAALDSSYRSFMNIGKERKQHYEEQDG